MGHKKIDKKVFEYTKMPSEVQEAFTEEMRDSNQRGANIITRDVYAECYDGTEDYVKVKDGEVIWREAEAQHLDGDYDFWDKDSNMILIRGNDIVSDWMIDNGADFWESVLIEY
jgi:hypothetical protein